MKLGGTLAGIAVSGHTLAELMERAGVRRVDLLKLNIEGAEQPVLAAATKALEAVAHVAVACHDFRTASNGDPALRTFDGVVDLLRTAGFTLRTRPHDPRPWVACMVYGSR